MIKLPRIDDAYREAKDAQENRKPLEAYETEANEILSLVRDAIRAGNFSFKREFLGRISDRAIDIIKSELDAKGYSFDISTTGMKVSWEV